MNDSTDTRTQHATWYATRSPSYPHQCVFMCVRACCVRVRAFVCVLFLPPALHARPPRVCSMGQCCLRRGVEIRHLPAADGSKGCAKRLCCIRTRRGKGGGEGGGGAPPASERGYVRYCGVDPTLSALYKYARASLSIRIREWSGERFTPRPVLFSLYG
jgi:hypothetical protein